MIKNTLHSRCCPVCGSYDLLTERRPDGNSICNKCGHKEPTSAFDDHILSVTKREDATKPFNLTHKGMVEVFSHRYYQCGEWKAKKGDYYVIGRSMEPFNLCRVVDIKDDKVFTVMLGSSSEISEWEEKDFHKGFGENRLYVPPYIFEYEDMFY